MLSYHSPSCDLLFKAVPEGIFSVAFAKGNSRDLGYDFARLKQDLDKYFKGKPANFKEPLLYDRRTFAGKVLSALRKIPSGSTVSYGRLAQKAGFPKASRAVGSVMAGNPLPFLIPCHRVILAGGKLGNFGSGKKLKEKLLHLEGAL